MTPPVGRLHPVRDPDSGVPTPVADDGKNTRRGDTNMNVGTVLTAERAERAAVAAWRRRQLDEAGFPAWLAAPLADDRRVDVHALIELVERGCRP
jgi:hypothetical protein